MNALIDTVLKSEILQYLMLLIRMISPLMALFVVWRSYTSFRKGLRRAHPVIILEDGESGVSFPVLYWENSIGRSKSCDIVLPDDTVSRDHAVLMRRDEGWLVCDTGSKSGVFVNGQQVNDKKLVGIGDTVSIGSRQLVLKNTQSDDSVGKKGFTGFMRRAASPFSLVLLTSLVHFLMAFQLFMGTGEIRIEPLLLFACITVISWVFYFISMRIMHRTTFELETIGLLLSGIGIMLLSGPGVEEVFTQLMAMLIGISIFFLLIWFMSDLERVTKWRLVFAIGAILLFGINMVLGKDINGSRNWIFIGPVSLQPSELIKIAFIFVGASTLDKLQTKKNIGEFIVFAALCLGFLFLMRDFGTACVFFAGFLIIAFMRSGSIRTIALILAVAVLGVMMIINFKPYVAQRFAGWGNVWEHINDSLGYQQTRTLTYVASGGLFGMGLGRGYLHYIAAGNSDLVFGMLCEEQGLLMGAVVVFALVLFIFFARNDVRRSRSTFFSICACAAAGIMVFQSCLNIFGATDILPLTGVTLPFISAGGTSMMSVWGLLAFLKASDERTYAARRKLKKRREGGRFQ